MYYEIVSKRTVEDKSGNFKDLNERFIVSDVETFSEAEFVGLQEYNSHNDITAIKRSVVRDFLNTRSEDEEDIYLATIEETLLNDDGTEKINKKVIGLYALNISKATEEVKEYMKDFMNDNILVGIKKTRFIDVIKK